MRGEATPFEIGAIARAAGKTRADNPYRTRAAAKLWIRGWWHEDEAIKEDEARRRVRPDGPETAEGGLIGQQPY